MFYTCSAVVISTMVLYMLIRSSKSVQEGIFGVLNVQIFLLNCLALAKNLFFPMTSNQQCLLESMTRKHREEYNQYKINFCIDIVLNKSYHLRRRIEAK